MSEFKREDRYLVLKRKDIGKYVDAYGQAILANILNAISRGRKLDGKENIECVVVESDWPEYESTWEAIKNRVTPNGKE